MPVNDPDQYYDNEPQQLPDATAGLGGQMQMMSPSMPAMMPQPHMQMMLPTAGIPSYTMQPGTYGYDDGSGYTAMRASYGNVPMMGMRGAQAVGSGAMMGIGDMFSAIGSQIAPIAYTPPARVFSDYGGRYVQNVGIAADTKTLLGFGPMMRAGREADMRYNAASDLGERIGLGLTGGVLSAAGLAASSFGSYLGGGLGVVGGLAGGLAGFALAGYATDKIQEGIAARRDVMGYLDATSDRYITSSGGAVDPRRGAGFSSAGRRQVADFVRGMDVNDPLLNSSELSSILKDSTQLGLFTGTRDIDEFKTRFKSIVDSVKTVTTTLHQTLEEGLKTIRDLRGIGVDPALAGGVALRSEIAGRAAGKSAGEMLNLGLQGAELFRGTGVSMQIGFESNIMNAVSIRAARDAGMLSQEAIAQAGGEEALAQRMTSSSLGYAQTAAGRGFSSLYFNGNMPGSGFSQQAFLNMVNAGGGDLSSNAMSAARNLGTPAALIKFQANQEGMLSEMGKMFGGQGLAIRADTDAMMQATRLSSITGASTEDSFKMILKTQQGKSEVEAQAELARIKNAGGAFLSAQRSAETTREQTIQQAGSQNFFVNRWQAELGDSINRAADVIAQPANEFVENVSQGTANFADYLAGTQRVNLEGAGYTPQVIGDPRRAARNRLSRAVDIDRGGILGNNAGEDLGRLVLAGKTGGYKLRSGNVTLLNRYGGGGSDVTVSLADLEESARIARNTGGSLAAAQEADARGELKDARGNVSKGLLGMMGKNTATSYEELVSGVFGRGMATLSRAEAQALQLETQNSPAFTQLISAHQKSSEAVLSAYNAVSVATEAEDLGKAEEARTSINRLLSPKSVMGQVGNALGFTQDKELSSAAIAKLAELNRIRLTGDDAAVERAKLSFKGELTRISGAGSDKLRSRADEFIDRAMSGDGQLTRLFTEHSTSYRALSDEQQRRGFEVLSGAVEADIFGASRALTTDDEKKKIQSIVRSIGDEGVAAVKSLGKDDLAVLSKTATGGFIAQEAKTIAAVTSLRQGASEADLRAALPAMPAAQLSAVSDAFARGPSQAIEAIHAQTLDQIASKTNVASAGATAGVGVNGAATSDQSYAVQTSMNLQVLQALTALASKLNGVR